MRKAELEARSKLEVGVPTRVELTSQEAMYATSCLPQLVGTEQLQLVQDGSLMYAMGFVDGRGELHEQGGPDKILVGAVSADASCSRIIAALPV